MTEQHVPTQGTMYALDWFDGSTMTPVPAVVVADGLYRHRRPTRWDKRRFVPAIGRAAKGESLLLHALVMHSPVAGPRGELVPPARRADTLRGLAGKFDLFVLESAATIWGPTSHGDAWLNERTAAVDLGTVRARVSLVSLDRLRPYEQAAAAHRQIMEEITRRNEEARRLAERTRADIAALEQLAQAHGLIPTHLHVAQAGTSGADVFLSPELIDAITQEA